MKTNKINTILVSLATAIIFIVGAGCHNSFFFGNPSDPTPTTTINSTKRGSLRIYIEKDIKTRTIIADANAITFDQYSIEMTSDDGFADRSGDFTASVADFNNIEAGTWNIAVKAKWSGQVLATGARSGIIIAPNTTTDLTVDIKLSQSATGNVKINIVFPTSSGITSLTAQLDGGASENLTLSVEGIQTTALFEATGVPSGIKDLVLTFKNAAGTILGMYRETVNIFDNLTSDRWINGSGGLQSSLIYPATYFASTNSNLSNLKTSYGLLGFASATYSYSMPVPNSVSTFNVKPTQGIVGQSIFVKFNGGTASMVRTDVSSDNFTLNDGDNTIDVEVTAQDRATKSHYTILVKRAPKPGVPVISGVENGYSYNIDKTLYLSSADSTSIRYTMTNDGSDPSDPTAASSPYSAPIDLTSDAGTKTIYKIKAVGFNSFGDASDVGGVWTVTIDKKPPAIYTLDPTDDATGVNSAAVLAITFDEDVMIDQPDKYVTIYRSIGDSEFEKIQINDNSKINWAAPNKITIDPSGTFWSAFRYYVKIDGGAVKDLAGNSFAGINDSTTWNFKIANTGGAPYITDISSDPVNGSFKQGDSIIIKVKFSEAVTVTGSPTLSLNSGATKATFAGGGLTNTLRFTYTVGAGDNTADLDVTSINLPILPLPAMITDGSNHADLDLPNSPNRLRDNSNIVIDTTKPTIEGGAMSADNSYVTITFSEGVYTNAGASGGLVAGDFSIQLNGGTATGATITGVSSDSGGALSGGESVVRVYFTITGSPSGEETIEIKPVVTNLIYDAAGNSVDTSQTTGQLELNISVAYICGDKDSGIVPVDTTVYTSGETVTVADNTGDNRLIKTRDGISLKLSWNTKADGTGTTYQSGGTFTIGSTSVTLYAMWSALRCTGPAGGLIFYDKGNYIDGWRYLEAATTDLSNSAWANNGDITTGATETGFGTGKLNASKITSAFSGNYAAQRCANYTSGAYNDWFLPSKEELNAMYTELKQKGVGGFSDAIYWSSSERDAATSWGQDFSNGTVNGAGHSKLSAYRVRAVRSFGPDATAPTLPSGSITAIVAGPDSITLSWNYAEDNSTDQSSLQYRVYYSNSSYKVSTVTACETNGTPAGYYTTNINAKTIPVSLGAPTLCYNVVVRDNSGNKKCYTPKWAGLYSVTYDRNNSDPGGTVPDTGYYANNQMVTVAENTGSLVKMQDGISLRLLWNTNASGLGTSYKPGSGTFAMNETNVTLYAKWEVVGCTGPAEGLIFYDKGNYDDGWRYLEAAPISTEWTSKRWAPPDKTNTYVGVSPKSVGVGKQNTIKIIDKYGNTTNDYAAKLCADLSHDGYNDWFLPSDAELAEVANVRVEGGFSSGTGNLYWSSSEWNNASAYAKDLIYPSSSSSTSKATTYFVRAVRSFGNDATPPTFPSGSDITITGVNSTSVELEWALATDGNGAGGSTLDANLQYRIYYSTSAADVSTVTACETNGTPFGYYNYYSAPAGKTVTGLTGISTGTTYWFNIVVRDNSGNKACYSATSAGLFKVTYHENGDTTGDVPVDNNYYATGQTVTVAGRGTLEKIEDNISLRLIWNTKATGGGTDHTVDVGTFDMPPNNVTLYAKWTALGCTGPAGGLIFYDKGAGNYSDGWRYLEAAPSDQSSGIRWGAKTAVAGATGDGYGAGKQNTINIIAHYGDATEDYAAKLCADLSHDGYNDWFLPSSYELGAMYTKLYKSGVGGFTAEPYWSSSEFGDNAVMRDFGGFGNPPAPTSHSKTNNCRVRAARSFGNDTTPPTVPTASDITADVNSGSVTLSWYIASDNSTYQASLQYRIYYSAYDNISTVEACETNGTPFGYYNYYSSNPASKTVTGLPGGTYYFNVVVRDNSGNKACYTAAGPLNLFKVTYDGNGAASGSAPVDANIYTSGQTVTVLGEGTLAKTHDGINLRVACWNTQSDGMGTDYQPGATFTIGTANVTLYAKWTALKCYGPAGGLIFYDKGNYDNGWRYMEAAPSSAETEWDSKVWGGYGTAVPGADGTTTGSGKQNTIDIVAQYGAAEPHQNKTDYAAKLCADLSYGGYNDWFLPSTSELETMLTLRGDGGFPDNVLYWSSTEVYGDNSNKSIAMEYNTTYNNITSYYKEKHQSYRVRAARSF